MHLFLQKRHKTRNGLMTSIEKEGKQMLNFAQKKKKIDEVKTQTKL